MRLWRNGAADPDRWEPPLENRRDGAGGVGRPEVGDLVAWRYAAWRVHRATPVPEVDLTDGERSTLNDLADEGNEIMRARCWPVNIVLRHERGPIIAKPGEEKFFKRLRDGSNTTEVHFTTWPATQRWIRLVEPYRVCSCHGHPWACQEIDRMSVAHVELERFQKLEAAHAAGMCAACREPISARQKFVTFPEPSLLLPGAPGPTFHTGRAHCWSEAENYERAGRLTQNPNIDRLASCPGVRFIHEARNVPAQARVECTAGDACTGLHGPPGYRAEVACWHKIRIRVEDTTTIVRPRTNCGYHTASLQTCVGRGSDDPDPLSAAAADLLWQQQQEQRHTPARTGT